MSDGIRDSERADWRCLDHRVTLTQEQVQWAVDTACDLVAEYPNRDMLSGAISAELEMLMKSIAQARDLLAQSEAERETLKSERRGLLGLVRAALVDVTGTTDHHMLDMVASVKDKLRESETERERLKARFTAPIVCMCGSTRFKQSWISENARLTGEGYIVLAVGLWGHHERVFPSDAQKAMLDALHKRKIDLCDWVWVLDVGGYIGSSTRSEIEYAEKLGKPVRYLSAECPGYQEPVDPVAAERDRLARDLAAKESTLRLYGSQVLEHASLLEAMGVSHASGEWRAPFYNADGSQTMLTIPEWIEQRKKWARELAEARAESSAHRDSAMAFQDQAINAERELAEARKDTARLKQALGRGTDHGMCGEWFCAGCQYDLKQWIIAGCTGELPPLCPLCKHADAARSGGPDAH